MQVASRQCLWKDTIAGPGTLLAVEASSDCMTVRIARGDLAPGSTSVTVGWGDGTKSVYLPQFTLAQTIASSNQMQLKKLAWGARGDGLPLA